MILTEEIDRYDDQYLITLRDGSTSSRNASITAIDLLNEMVFEEQTAAMNSANQSISNSIFILMSSNILAISIGVIIVLLISRMITANLNKVVNITTEVSNGNLAVESMDYKGKDEIGRLAGAVNQMKEQYSKYITKGYRCFRVHNDK